MTDKQYIFSSIFVIANKLQIIGDREIEELSFKQWFLLVAIKNISKENPSLTDIADFVGTSRQNVKKMLVILEKKGYVVLRTLPDNQKSVCTLLTKKCVEHLDKFDKLGDELLEKVFTDISPAQIQLISETFKMLFGNIDKLLKSSLEVHE